MKGRSINMDEKPSATFVASIRTDLKYTASIALFFSAKGKTFSSRTALLNEGTKIMGEFFLERFPVESYSKAIEILQSLGYGNALEKGSRYYKSLFRELAKEERRIVDNERQAFKNRENQEALNSRAVELTKTYNKKALGIKEEIPEEIPDKVLAKEPESLKEVPKEISPEPSEEESQTPVDLSKKPTRMTQEDIDAANAKNARDTADMRKGLKAGIVASDK